MQKELSELKQKLLSETATIHWSELQRFFAQGNVLAVGNGADLIEIAAGFAEDDADTVQKYLNSELVAPVSDDQARDWIESNAEVWSVVVAPFVLVQIKTPHDEEQ